MRLLNTVWSAIAIAIIATRNPPAIAHPKVRRAFAVARRRRQSIPATMPNANDMTTTVKLTKGARIATGMAAFFQLTVVLFFLMKSVILHRLCS